MPYKNLADKLARQRWRRDRDWRANVAKYSNTTEFVACDGEGYFPPKTIAEKVDLFFEKSMRQEYGLLRMGENLLYDGGPLSTETLLDFIAEQPKRTGRVYVGYYFDYDATMILRDLPLYILKRILRGEYTHYERWVIRYHPKQFIEVGRADRNGRTIPGSIVTINEVGAFFQCKYTEALKQWGIGTPEIIARIQQGKDRRGTETEIDADTIEYNGLECDYLTQLMQQFAEVVSELDLKPAKWRGPGWIAAKALRNNSVPRREPTEKLIPDDLRMHAPMAYYGGRFEITCVGEIGEVYAYDINSAYPAAMEYLPCIRHAKFVKYRQGEDISDHTLAYIEFDHPDKALPLCGIPIRTKEGLCFPRQGKGWYWGVEINAAIRAGMTVKVYGGWHVRKQCACKPFEFIRGLYDERRRVGKDRKGIALKLAYNSIYGKLVQSVGSRPFYNPIWAGLITSYVRATLIKAYIDNIHDVVMLATDAVYSRKPMKLPLSKNLGEWGEEYSPDMFIVQPGIYEAVERKTKTRGINDTLMKNAMPTFREAWRDFIKYPSSITPAATVECNNFVSLKLAFARENLRTAGSWHSGPRRISFDWIAKRDLAYTRKDGYIQTMPQQGGPWLESLYYDPNLYNVRRELDIMRHSQPDYMEVL